MSGDLVTQSAALVRRARAGDENAMAMILRVGQEARGGNNRRASAAFAALKDFIDRNPARPFVLGTEAPPLVADEPPADAPSTALARTPSARELERRKPRLPRGAFDRLFDPQHFAVTILRACGYRHGLPAAAVTLASGPPLTAPVVQEIGATQFGSDESRATFFHGVRFCDDEDWKAMSPHLEAPLKRCLAIGQCVGRARRIQAVRQPQSRISDYSEVAGWELGESL